MKTRKITIVVDVPDMFDRNDVRDVFRALDWHVVSVSVSDEAAQHSIEPTSDEAAHS